MPMVPSEAFPFCGPTYLAASPVIDAQRSINLYPEPGCKSSKTGMALIGRPGITGLFIIPTAPVRSLWAGNNRMFGVGGTHFYELTGGVSTDYGAMAGSTGAGFCQVQANTRDLTVMDSSASKIYSADTVGHSMTAQFNAVALEYLDGFYVAIATGASLSSATNPNQLNVSAFMDGTSWPALNFVLRTSSSDLTRQLCSNNGLLWVLGEKSMTAFYNAGNPTFPFARASGTDIGLGILSPASLVKFYNTFMWLGADDRGSAQVYMMQGTNPLRVSNPAIENMIAFAPNLFGLQTKRLNTGLAWARGYQEAGHTFYCLTFVDNLYRPQAEIVYDLTTGLWHERTYAAATGNWPICAVSLANISGGSDQVIYVGDGLTGIVFEQSILDPNDNGNNITYTRTAPHLSNQNRWMKHSRFELDGDMAGVFGSAAPTLDYSDDGGRTFGGRSLPLLQAPDQGRGTVSPTFRRYFATQLGRSRDRVYKVTITDNRNLIRIANAYLTVNPGTEK